MVQVPFCSLLFSVRFFGLITADHNFPFHSVCLTDDQLSSFLLVIPLEFISLLNSRPLLRSDDTIERGLTRSFEEALRNYKQHNGQLPERVLVYRDGVGDGMY